MKELNGSELVEFIKERQAREVRRLKQSKNILPKLGIIFSNPSKITSVYTKIKQTYGRDIGVEVVIDNTEPEKIVEAVNRLNTDMSVQGIIVQLPLTDTTQTDAVIEMVALEKDVDGLRNDTRFDAPTPTAINWLLAGYNISLEGKKIVIIGDGRLVGAPLKKMWHDSGLDVTTIDEHTKNPGEIVSGADIIVSAVGVAGLVTNDMVKPGAVVIDAGVATDGEKLTGDVSPEVRQRDDITITPIKGGVGPLTVAALFENVLQAARNTTH